MGMNERMMSKQPACSKESMASVGLLYRENRFIKPTGSDIVSAGQSTTFKWYASGCRTLDDIKSGKGGVKLTPAQEIGVRFYDGQRSSFVVF